MLIGLRCTNRPGPTKYREQRRDLRHHVVSGNDPVSSVRGGANREDSMSVVIARTRTHHAVLPRALGHRVPRGGRWYEGGGGGKKGRTIETS